MSNPIIIVLLPFYFLVSIAPGRAEVVLEEGYTVSTVLDGNKLKSPIHPYSLLPYRQGEEGREFVFLLDSVNSALYRVQLPLSQDCEIERLAGKGISGYSDGDAMASTFKHPRSFTVDSTGNIYVADRSNHVIRKISSTSVTTIAGGYSKKSGNVDGPAQNASFSDDFDLAFIPSMCMLLISDRGNSLIRQIPLKREDCAHKFQSGLGMSSVSIIAVLCVLIGSIVGFVARPYLTCCEIQGNHRFKVTWKHCQTSMGMMLEMLCSGIKSATAKTTVLYMLSYKLVASILCFVLHLRKDHGQEKQVINRKPIISLLDLDGKGNHGTGALENFTDQLSDLTGFSGYLGISEPLSPSNASQMDTTSNENLGKLDSMIASNLSDFVGQPKLQEQLEVPVISNSALFRRKTGVSSAKFVS